MVPTLHWDRGIKTNYIVNSQVRKEGRYGDKKRSCKFHYFKTKS